MALSEARRGGLERLLETIERTPDSAALTDRLCEREAVIGRLGREIEELRVELAGPRGIPSRWSSCAERLWLPWRPGKRKQGGSSSG